MSDDFIMRNKLVNKLLEPFERDCRKHALSSDIEGFAVDQVNALSRMALLYEVGEIINGMLEELETKCQTR